MGRLRPAIVVLGVVAGLMPAPVPVRLRCALFIFGIFLGLCGTWMLVPALLAPRAVLAAGIGAIRGDLWAEAAFTGAHFMGTDHSTRLDRTNLRHLERTTAKAA